MISIDKKKKIGYNYKNKVHFRKRKLMTYQQYIKTKKNTACWSLRKYEVGSRKTFRENETTISMIWDLLNGK